MASARRLKPAEVRPEARRRYPRSRPLQTAFVRGWAARRDGKPWTANPYRNLAGWGTSWRRAWETGWHLGPPVLND